MKKADIKQVNVIISTLEGLLEETEQKRDAAQAAYDRMSENRQEDEPGIKAQELIDQFEEAAQSIQATIDALSNTVADQ